jgi:P4 family phage/plasmid primase-like protien
MTGFALTGSTQEHALFFLYGTGANGKLVFVNTLATILGDYAANAPMDTFMETRTDRHPTDMAGLRGARFVAAIETEQGRRWAESKIKNLMGGDKISARFMRQDCRSKISIARADSMMFVTLCFDSRTADHSAFHPAFTSASTELTLSTTV